MTKPSHHLNSQGTLEKIKWPKGEVVFNNGAVFLLKAGKDTFSVVYGLEVNGPFDYVEAAESLGLCLMHQMDCEGIL